MRNKIFFPIALLSALAMSCQVNLAPQEAPELSDQTTVRITAGLPVSKTAMAPDGKVTWLQTDRLGILPALGSGSSDVVDTLNAVSVNGNTAVFEGNAAASEKGYVVGYPAANVSGYRFNSSVDQIRVDVFYSQTVCDGSQAVAVGKTDAAGNVTLKQACALLKFTVEDADTFSKVEAISRGTEKLSGRLWLKTETCGTSSYGTMYPGVVYAPESGVIAPGTYYLCTIAHPSQSELDLVLESGLELKAYDKTGAVVMDKLGNNPVTLKAGAIVDLGLVKAGEVEDDPTKTKVTVSAIMSTPAEYQFDWAEGQEMALCEFCDDATSQTKLRDQFTVKGSKAAQFTVTLDKKDPATQGFSYVALLPVERTEAGTIQTPSKAGYRAYKAGNFSYAIGLNISQVPAADAPDPAYNIMAAKALNAGLNQPSTLTLDFQPVVAYGKVTVKNFPALAADETMTSFTITAPGGKVMRGRVFENLTTGELTPYAATAVANDIVVSAENISVNSTSFDVWFTTLPFDLAAGEELSFTATSSKQVYAAQAKMSAAFSFEKGKVAPVTVDFAASAAQVIVFDFKGASAVPAGWPTAAKQAWTGFRDLDSGLDVDNGGTNTENTHRRMTADFVVDGTAYSFILADADAATAHNMYWTKGTGLYIFAERYLGLPVISGKKISKITFSEQASKKSAGFRYMGVTEGDNDGKDLLIRGSKSDTVTPTGTLVPGGDWVDASNTAGVGTKYTFVVTNTVKDGTGVQLYLVANKQTSVFGEIEVTYVAAN